MAKKNLKQTAYDNIKQNIMNCKFEPGAFLNEEIVCSELCMSRTPVRDALGRLEQEGLVQIRPKKGFIISPLNTVDISRVYETRILLEPYIILNYCDNLPKEVLMTLKKCIELEQTEVNLNTSVHSYDDEFHYQLINRCTNEYLRKVLEDVHAQNTRIRVLIGRVMVPSSVGNEQHLAVYRALEQGNAAAAAIAMKEHLRASLQNALTQYVSKALGVDGNLKFPI